MYSHFNKSAPILTHCIYLSWNEVLASIKKNAFLAADARKRGRHLAAEDSYAKSFDPPVHAHPW